MMPRCGMLLLCLTAAACSTTPAQQQKYYGLDAGPVSAGRVEGRAEFPATIVVAPVAAHGVFAERPLLYRPSANSRVLEQYHFSEWREPPASMLRDALVGYLRAAFGDDRVLAVDTRLRPGYRVRSRLKRMEQILGNNSSRAALALEFTVTDAQDELLFVLDFAEEAAAAGLSVADHVVALEGLLVRACRELERRLAQVVATAAAPRTQ